MKVLELGISPRRSIGAVVFCHGFPGTNLNVPLAEALAARDVRPVLFRYTGVDEPGVRWSFGRSARDCAEVLRDARAAGPGPIVALGYSMGGLHVTRALRDAGLSLADALMLLGPVLSLASFRRHLGTQGGSAERFMSEGRGLLDEDASARIAEYAEIEREAQPLHFLASFALPTLVVMGTADTVVPDEIRTAASAMPDASALYVNDDHAYARSASRIADEITLLVRAARRS